MTRLVAALRKSRREALRLAGGCAALAIAGMAAPQAAANGQAILMAADQFRAPSDAFIFDIRLIDPMNRAFDLTVRVRDRTKGLVIYNQPASFAGRAILYVGQNMWAYVPGTRRALRISPKQRLLGGAGTADVARTVFSEDYSVTGISSSGGKTILDLSAAGRGAAYGRILLTVSSSDSRPLNAEFYAANGPRRLKTQFYEDYQDVLGLPRPMRIRIIDHLDDDAETVMRYFNMRLEDTPAAWFQPSYLERL